MESDEKACPYCAETIKAAAVKCRFCGEMLGAAPPQAGTIEQSTKPIKYSVEVTDAGTSLIEAIKAIRELSGLSLSAAKIRAERLPAIIMDSLSMPEAEDVKAKLEAKGLKARIVEGGTVAIKIEPGSSPAGSEVNLQKPVAGCIGLLTLAVIFVAPKACSPSTVESSAPEARESQAVSKSLSRGDVVTLKKDTLVFYTEAAWDTRGAEALANKVAIGEAIMLAPGSRVSIAGQGVTYYEVTVLDGVDAGKTGWVERELLESHR